MYICVLCIILYTWDILILKEEENSGYKRVNSEETTTLSASFKSESPRPEGHKRVGHDSVTKQ